MAQTVRFLFDVFELNDDGTKTLTHEGITAATRFSSADYPLVGT